MGPTFESLLVKNGLVLFLDAGNIKSYPNSGTVWRDPTTVNLSGTITGATYTSLNDGTFLFDSTDTVASNNGIAISNAFTVFVWLKHRTLPNSIQRWITIGDEAIVMRHEGSLSVGRAHFYIKTNNTIRTGVRVNSAVANNTFYNFVGTWDGTTQTLYKNLTSIGTHTPPAGTLNGGTALNWTLSSLGEPFNGEMYSVAVYNRVLTATELYINYYAFLNNRVKTARPANILLFRPYPRIYYVAGPNATWATPTSTEIMNGQLAGGSAATAAWSESAPLQTTAGFNFSQAASPLVLGTKYRAAAVQKAGNSNVVSNVIESSIFLAGGASLSNATVTNIGTTTVTPQVTVSY